ncbi:nitroreductase family protein [Lentibacillus amyloliquefaciens]|uniref:Nitroreductase n=1 Tax=Lentibacillus amyloliquefaciens TaxID=1472767 RepID=A0A0U3WBV6_9BACI|nr:nitroreductase [Lentibacillus amyloliquefaciens]ALX50418.1 nitroreductase [Lentibacillus amyloliquefaciens]
MIPIDLLTAIKARRSIHNFKHDEIDHATLREILTYGSYAPTHYMKEPWQIKLYEKGGKQNFVDAIIASYQRIGMLKTSDDDKTQKMIGSMKQFLLQIPHHALIYFKEETDHVRYEEEYAAVCAFIQNAQLAAWAYGIGMLWTITPYMHDKGFAEEIGLDSSSDKIAAVMQIGYPEKIPRDKGRTPIGDKLEFISE